MDLKTIIRSDYEEYIKITPMNTEMRRALLDQERVPLLLVNLQKQLFKVKNVPRGTIKMAVYNITEMFVKAFKQKADETIMSDMEKLRIKQEHDDKVAFEQEADALFNTKDSKDAKEEKI